MRLSLALLVLAPSLLPAEDLSRYPILEPGVQAHYLSSYDRAGGNDDGFDGTYSALYVDVNGEHVIFDAAVTGRLEVEIRVRTPGWNEFRYELWGRNDRSN